jgi:putative ABC transport system permease protein
VDAVGRLAAGVSAAAAAAAATVVSAQLAREFPDTNEGVTLTVIPVREHFVAGLRPYLPLLLGAVIVVLAVACANVGGLLLARGIERRRDVAVRVALGANRRHMAQLVLAESMTLAAVGGFAGVALAWGLLHAVPDIPALALPSWIRLSIDAPVLAFAAAAMVLTGFAAALPTLRLRQDGAVLGQATRSRTAAPRDRSLQRSLIIAEVALAVTLTAAATLLARTAVALSDPALGFDAQRVLTFRVALTWYTYPAERVPAFHRAALETIRRVPGVVAASINSNLPLGQLGAAMNVVPQTDRQSGSDAAANPYVHFQRVDGTYFDTLAIRRVGGRVFSDDDRPGTAPVAVVSAALARRLWPAADPIGQRIRAGREAAAPWLLVVGVVDDVHHVSPAEPAGPALYVSIAQFPSPNVFFAVRTTLDPSSLIDAVREAIWSVDASQAVFDIAPLDARVRALVWRQRAAAVLFTAFAGVALFLAGVGLHGVVAHLVGQRTREIGLRLALGASPGRVMQEVVGDSVRVAAIGCAIGLGGAVAASQVLMRSVPGLERFALWTLAAPLPVVLGIAAMAAFGPAWRARSTDPAITLHVE